MNKYSYMINKKVMIICVIVSGVINSCSFTDNTTCTGDEVAFDGPEQMCDQISLTSVCIDERSSECFAVNCGGCEGRTVWATMSEIKNIHSDCVSVNNAFEYMNTSVDDCLSDDTGMNSETLLDVPEAWQIEISCSCSAGK